MDILNEKTDLMVKRFDRLAEEEIYFELKKEICNIAINIIANVN